MQIILKSGVSVTVSVGKFVTSSGHDPADGGLNRLTWTTPVGWSSKLVFVNLDEVAAVLAHRQDCDDNGH